MLKYLSFCFLQKEENPVSVDHYKYPHVTHNQHVVIMAIVHNQLISTSSQHFAHSTSYPLSSHSQLVVMLAVRRDKLL